MVKKLALIGTTSSGKSTIANLLAGHYVLPSGVQETSTSAIDIVISDYQKEYYVKGAEFCLVVCDQKARILERSCLDYDDMRSTLHRIMEEEYSNLSMRLDLYKKRRYDSLHKHMHYLTRRILAGRPPLQQFLQMPSPCIITDFPGFRHEGDKDCLQMIFRKIQKDTHILFVFNAEETDSMKENRLLRYLFLILRKKGMHWSCVSFVLNRKEVFLRDSEPEAALQKNLTLRKTLIQRGISERYGEDSAPEIICISADAILTAELLFWHDLYLSGNDLQFLNGKILNWSSAILPDDLLHTLPRATKDWKTRHWVKAFQAIQDMSGFQAFSEHLKTRVFC